VEAILGSATLNTNKNKKLKMLNTASKKKRGKETNQKTTQRKKKPFNQAQVLYQLT
jgi:hypothetical protein